MAELSIRDLNIRQFRSHGRADLELDTRPIAIYGSNGAGKTNILEAVSLLSPGRGIRRAAAEDMARAGVGLGWKVSAAVQSAGHLHEIELSYQTGGPKQVRINGKPAVQADLGRIARVLWLVPVMDRLWIEGADGRRRFLDRATLSFEPSHAETTLAYEKAMRERNRLLKDMVRDPHWYRALEAQLAETGLQISQNRQAALAEIINAQAGADTAFPAAQMELAEGEHGLPKTVEDYQQALADTRARDIGAGRTLIGPHRADLHARYAAKGIAAKDCSTGEQKALLISLVLANARALKMREGMPPIVLLDEVAAHLDANRRAALYDEITALGSQAWMTGTGPELFAELGHRAQYVEVTETNGLSVVVQKDLPV